ncbi:MAG: type II toxin-antitoxin system Phd/YefM family antitoxin [Anaerolineales bacterium]|nr:type II toxin-antitoxin system Phd/YefM family antitoxin [Anaerolineales bacterium]
MSTRTISSTEAQNNFGRILNDTVQNGTRYIIKRRDTPQAIILSLSDFENLLDDPQKLKILSQVIREVSPVYEFGKPIGNDENDIL